MSKEAKGIYKAWEATIKKSTAAAKKSQALAKKRAQAIFAIATTMSVAHADDDEPGTNDLQHIERVLSDGEFYTGQCYNNLPHGNGKYLWTDGCMYVGEWYKGKTLGKGRFSWPSGATYEGDFKSGFMDGKGMFTGATGDTYRGFWVMNLKHGQGSKSYANGDCYEGEWKRGLQDGQGKYQWQNGNCYVGHWRDGSMSGSGTMVWNNGNRYEGLWERGFPKGKGTFKFSDGSSYVGTFSKDTNEQSGSYYPSGSSASANFDWDPQEIYTIHLKDCSIYPDEQVSILPSQKITYWPGTDNHPGRGGRRVSVDGRLSNYSWSSEGNGVSTEEGFHVEGSPARGFGKHQLRIKPVKKQGHTIAKGHKNYELMLNLQLGIRHSVGRPAPAINPDLKSSAFDPREKVWTKFPPEGSKHTPPHQSCDFKWKDYCPVVFRTLRKLFNVDAADYMISLCGNDALRELSSPGKSGSFFYLTNDDKYMIKTMKKAEVKVFLRMLPAYYNHFRSFENTLVTKFYGLHCVKLTGTAQKKVRFVIMGNLFCNFAIHRRFDLKGSSHGRSTTIKPEAEIDPNTTLKDLDLNFIFRLQKAWFQEFCQQVDRDCDFLEHERIMDYSLLVGLHFRETTLRGDCIVPFTSASRTPSGLRTPTGNGDEGGGPRLSGSDMDKLLDPTRWASVRLGISMPSRVERTMRKPDCENQLVGEPTGEFYEVILYFGIIDILQDYDISKKLEHAYKSMHYDPTSISAVDPKQYSKRFRDFIFRVFVEEK
ncbi:hypothetical protein ACFE04_010368 [Oxalis oulophora]